MTICKYKFNKSLLSSKQITYTVRIIINYISRSLDMGVCLIPQSHGSMGILIVYGSIGYVVIVT